MNQFNEEERRRHDKSWNDPPMFSYDQLNNATTIGHTRVPLHKRYHAPPAPEMTPGYRPPGAGYPPSYGMPQPGYSQQTWQNQAPQAQGYPTAGWQQQQQTGPVSMPHHAISPTSPAGSWGQSPPQSPPITGPGAPYPASSYPGQPITASSYGPQTGYSQQQTLPLGPQSIATSGYNPTPLLPASTSYQPSITSVTGSIPGSIPAPGFAPSLSAQPQAVPAYPSSAPVTSYSNPVTSYPPSGTTSSPNYYYQQQPYPPQ